MPTRSLGPIAAGAGPSPRTEIEVHGINVIMVNSLPKLAVAIQQLSRYETLAIDLEGVSLGREGEIAIIQISTARRSDVYLIDVCALGQDAFDHRTALDSEAGTVDTSSAASAGIGSASGGYPRVTSLRMLLEDPAVTKLLWDVRSDSNALFFLFGIRLAGVLDLQVYDCVRRAVDGRTNERVSGLGFVLERTPLGKLSVVERERVKKCKEAAISLFSPEYGGSYEVWKQRPLPALLLEYCTDSRYFFSLLESYRETFRDGARKRFEQLFATCIQAAVQRRIESSQTLGFSRNNREAMIAVDPVLLTEVRHIHHNAKYNDGTGSR